MDLNRVCQAEDKEPGRYVSTAGGEGHGIAARISPQDDQPALKGTGTRYARRSNL